MDIVTAWEFGGLPPGQRTGKPDMSIGSCIIQKSPPPLTGWPAQNDDRFCIIGKGPLAKLLILPNGTSLPKERIVTVEYEYLGRLRKLDTMFEASAIPLEQLAILNRYLWPDWTITENPLHSAVRHLPRYLSAIIGGIEQRLSHGTFVRLDGDNLLMVFTSSYRVSIENGKHRTAEEYVAALEAMGR